jgi:hypothetical protein
MDSISLSSLPAGVNSVGANESPGPANFPTHHLGRRPPPTIATALSSTTTLTSISKRSLSRAPYTTGRSLKCVKTATISGIEAVTGRAAPLLDAEVASASHLTENTDATQKALAAARCMPDRYKSQPTAGRNLVYPLIRVEGYGEV